MLTDRRAGAVINMLAEALRASMVINMLIDVDIILVVIALEFTVPAPDAIDVLADVRLAATSIDIEGSIDVRVNVFIDSLADVIIGIVSDIGVDILPSEDTNVLAAVMTASESNMPSPLENSVRFC